MKRLLAAFALLIVVATSGLSHRAHADVNDFVINDFTADYYLTRDDPQGQLHVVEQIDLTFSDFNHGILRALPDSYKGKPLKLKVNKISSDSGAPSQYTTYGDSGNTVLKIGDPDQTVTGQQKYTIDYTMQNVITFYDDHDELYWNINGTQWGQPFTQVTANFHMPQGLQIKDKKCFTGAIGNTQQSCTITDAEDGIKAATTRRLLPYETLTAVMSIQKGYFAQPTAADWWKDNMGKVLAVTLPPILIGGWAYFYWRKNGKDLKGRGTIIAEYEPPDGLKPLEVGVIADYRADNRDITATIVDLAIRGYIKIIETKKDRLIGKDKVEYSLELRKADFSGLTDFEKSIMQGIFTEIAPAPGTGANVVTLTSLKNKFYKTVTSVREDVLKSLTEKDYFPKNPKLAGGGMWAFAGVLFFVSFFFRNFLTIGLILAAALVALFASLMTKRTEKGVAAKEKIEGLKLYLNTAEKDRLAMLQSPDSPYAQKSEAPKQTVQLFEKLLPYAMVLGVENEWAKQFADIYKTPPDWYTGNWATFNAIYLTSSLASSVGAMSTNFSPPSSSGSSGFGGGGFSGGGGGGGGGGGW